MQTFRGETISSAEAAGLPPAASLPAPVAPRIAYLLSQYPAISHTFFLHEVMGLRERGLHIETASINAPDRPFASLTADEAVEARATRYIKPARPLAAALELLQTAAASPLACLRGLRAWAAIPGLTLRKRLLWLFYLAEAVLVGRWMRQRNLDHLHVHFGGPVASVGMLAAQMWQIPFSLTIHGPEELLNHEAYHLREKLAAAKFVVCISDFCRSQLAMITPPADWHKFHVVRLGVDPASLSPRRSTALPERILELVVTGRMAPQKGHRILLEALLLLEQRGQALHTTFIGGGPEMDDLRAFVNENGLAHRVVFTGALAHPQTLTHLQRADLFALASFAEGIPVALMEAMALGLPCVSTSVAGIPELIRSGIDGLLAPPANAAAFADALTLLLQDPVLRRQLGASARQRIVSLYNLPRNQELLAQTFAREVTVHRSSIAKGTHP